MVDFFVAIEQALQHVLRYPNPKASELETMLYYHFGWLDCGQPPQVSGKRVRPLLTLLTAGDAWRTALPLACSVEILHNFSLIHDDIQDNSPQRRGRASIWQLWGVPQAINTGDALFTWAYLAIAEANELSSEMRTQAAQLLAHTCLQLTHGQYLDMDFERRPAVNLAQYLEMITGKTASLLATAAQFGALAANAPLDVQRHYANFAANIGLAFQIRDDLLGIWGTATQIGKSVSTDILTRKKSLPILYALEQSPALSDLYQNPLQPADVPKVLALLAKTDAKVYTEQQELYYTNEALAHLHAAQPTPAIANALQQLTQQLLQRTA